jgi:hypothetical protein
VRARFLDAEGQVQTVAGAVKRDAGGGLVVEHWADGIRRETAVPRDASVDRIGR